MVKLGAIQKYPYRKINGVKYYVDVDNNVFSVLNDNKESLLNAKANKIINNTSAKEFYKEAYKFKQKFEYGYVREQEEPNLSLLRDLSVDDAINSEGIKYKNIENNPYISSTGNKIFDEWFNTNNNETFIEDENSNFNRHRKEVIRNSIESNLIVAISNYNNIYKEQSGTEVNFAMPKLKDEEWEELTTNISMITFLQGLNIGGKIYNGYAYVPNDINEDFVSEDSIYITANNKYYKVTDVDLTNGNVDINNATGVFNVDFERRTIEGTYNEVLGNSYKNESAITRLEELCKERGTGELKVERTANGTIENVYIKHKRNIYFYPKEELGSYTSIITLNSDSGIDLKNGTGNTHKITGVEKKTYDATNKEYKILQLYYTALGRERYGMRRVTISPFPTTSKCLEE